MATPWCSPHPQSRVLLKQPLPQRLLPLLLPLLLLVLLSPGLGPSPAEATSYQDIVDMKAYLQARGGFSSFLTLFQQAEAFAGFSTQGAINNFPITVFAPVDSGFANLSPANYENFRCFDPSNPTSCSYPIIAFHMAKQQLLFRDLAHAAPDTLWDTIEGSSIQKFRGIPSCNRFGFIVGPQFGGDFGALAFSPSAVLVPQIYTSANITVHAISAPMPPPTVYPRGFTLIQPRASTCPDDRTERG